MSLIVATVAELTVVALVKVKFTFEKVLTSMDGVSFVALVLGSSSVTFPISSAMFLSSCPRALTVSLKLLVLLLVISSFSRF